VDRFGQVDQKVRSQVRSSRSIAIKNDASKKRDSASSHRSGWSRHI
jgi:hypothetical protein